MLFVEESIVLFGLVKDWKVGEGEVKQEWNGKIRTKLLKVVLICYALSFLIEDSDLIQWQMRIPGFSFANGVQSEHF